MLPGETAAQFICFCTKAGSLFTRSFRVCIFHSNSTFDQELAVDALCLINLNVLRKAHDRDFCIFVFARAATTAVLIMFTATPEISDFRYLAFKIFAMFCNLLHPTFFPLRFHFLGAL